MSEEKILMGRYRLGKMVGAGGMAVVYRALDLETHEHVAVKMLRPELMKDIQLLRQFRKETQIVNQYQHRNIVRTLDTGEEDGVLFIVMEYIEGETLKEYIERNAPLSHEKAVEIGAQLCDALFYAHSHHLIHRDIKPQNILMTADGTIKVTDFGIARIAQPSTTTMNANQAVGSVHYAAPEQVRGRRTTAQSDIYSAGCVLYEMVTGHLPFEGESAVEIAIKQLNDEPVLPSKRIRGLSPALEQVILKAMEKDPECRYATAREMDNDLRRSLREPNGTFVERKASNGRFASTMNIQLDEIREGASALSRKVRQTTVPTGPRLNAFQVILLIVIVAGLAVAGVLLKRINDERAALISNPESTTVPIPGVVGKSANEAQQILAGQGLHSALVEEASEEVPAGVVIAQEPEQDSAVTKGAAVKLVVSSGPPQAIIPDLAGKSPEEAQAELESLGFILGEVAEVTDDTVPAGCVVRQDPIAETSCVKGTVVAVWIRAQVDTVTFSMPDVVGMTEDNVGAYLQSQGLELGEVHRIPSSSYGAGVIIQQSPAYKSTVAEGSAVELWISNGLSTMYKKTVPISVTVEKDTAFVQVVALLDEGEIPIYQQELTEGEHSLEVTFETATEGTKTLVVTIDNTEDQRISVEVQGLR